MRTLALYVLLTGTMTIPIIPVVMLFMFVAAYTAFAAYLTYSCKSKTAVAVGFAMKWALLLSILGGLAWTMTARGQTSGTVTTDFDIHPDAEYYEYASQTCGGADEGCHEINGIYPILYAQAYAQDDQDAPEISMLPWHHIRAYYRIDNSSKTYKYTDAYVDGVLIFSTKETQR